MFFLLYLLLFKVCREDFLAVTLYIIAQNLSGRYGTTGKVRFT